MQHAVEEKSILQQFGKAHGKGSTSRWKLSITMDLKEGQQDINGLKIFGKNIWLTFVMVVMNPTVQNSTEILDQANTYRKLKKV